MKIVACIIARTSSTRLKKKVLKEVKDISMIEHIILRLKQVEKLDEIYICTTRKEEDKVLSEVAIRNDVKFYAGSELSVIDRMLDVADLEDATHVVRVTGDNIFTDHFYLDKMVKTLNENIDFDYIRTEYLPIGATPEIIKVTALRDCKSRINKNESEYLFWFIFNPEIYSCGVIIPEEKYRKPYANLSVDTPNDWERTLNIFNKTDSLLINVKDILSLNDIPYFNVSDKLQIKLPRNTQMSYGEFRLEIEERIKKAYKIYE